MIAALSSALALLLSGSPQAEVAAMTPIQKAHAVVVAGMPAPAGFAGVLVRQWTTDVPRPRGALTFADQEGGLVKTFAALPPFRAASSYRSSAEAFAAGRDTAAALRRAGVHADFAPVLDLPDGPLGSRHFARPEFGVAFARGLGKAACVKHFPGLGSTPKSTDEARVYGVLRAQDLAPFRASIRAGVPCVWSRTRSIRASAPDAPRSSPRPTGSPEPRLPRGRDHRLARDPGSPHAPYWARLAIEAGADLVLTTSARDAERMATALLPLARSGALDAKLVRVAARRGQPGYGARSTQWRGLLRRRGLLSLTYAERR